MRYIYTMEYYSAEKNNDIMKFVDRWIELENIILSDVIQTQKDKHGALILLQVCFSRSKEGSFSSTQVAAVGIVGLQYCGKSDQSLLQYLFWTSLSTMGSLIGSGKSGPVFTSVLVGSLDQSLLQYLWEVWTSLYFSTRGKSG
ncbi:hypothetical protein STEG23_021783 [Scotinomys teguina]